MADGYFPCTNIQRFSVHDGPGIRTTVFLKGCPLRCRWCHNPETKKASNELFYTARQCISCHACAAVCPTGVHRFEEEAPYHTLDRSLCRVCGLCAAACPAGALELAARDMRPEEILEEVLRDLPFYGDTGGITLSGGEPMLHGEKTLQLLRLAKEAGLSTAMETCGYFDSDFIPSLCELVDLFLYDVKDMNSRRHEQNTGVPNEKILANLREIDRRGGKTLLRCVSVHGINLFPDHYEALPDLYHSLSHVQGVELLPYHAMGGSKSERLGHENDGHSEWVPPEEELEEIRRFLRSRGVRVIE